jgi:hypothetical protein
MVRALFFLFSPVAEKNEPNQRRNLFIEARRGPGSRSI